MAPNGLVLILYGIALVAVVEAWLPSSATMPVLPASRVEDPRGKAASRNKIPPFAPLRSAKDESGATSSRPDLKMMKQRFEQSMDSKLVMEYVKARESVQVIFKRKVVISMLIHSHSTLSPVLLGICPCAGRRPRCSAVIESTPTPSAYPILPRDRIHNILEATLR